MEPVKNMKSSPENQDLSIPSPGDDGAVFSLHPTLWTILGRDPQLSKEIDRRVSDLVESRVRELAEAKVGEASESLLAQAKADAARVMEEARTEGRAQGALEVREKVKAAALRMEAVCAEVIEAKTKLMREHEREWCLAMKHLLKRFLVPRSAEIVAGLGSWIEESLGLYASTHKIKVFVTPSEFDALSAVATSGGHWELIRDPALKEGEVRCESGGAGVFFSPEEQTRVLDEIVNRFMEEPSSVKT